MRGIAVLLLLLAGYGALLGPFAEHLQRRPIVEKVGYTPQEEVLELISAEHRQLVAESLVMRVLFYFGSLVELHQRKIDIPPDYFQMYKTIEKAVRLDPYNMDAYYFAQAIMVWDVGRVKEANALLEHGMQYRTWDFYLPFFAGFNYAYFLKDYDKAARYYRKAAELSGTPLYATLAGRYLYEAGRTDLALAYLTTMEKSATSDAIRKSFQTRITALKALKVIEEAVARYRAEHGDLPVELDGLVSMGYLAALPEDPYGGQFYLEEDGRVRTTSNLAFGQPEQDTEGETAQ